MERRMDRIEDILEAELAHLRKMLAMMRTGGATMRSHQGKDITAEIAEEHQVREVEVSAALDRHRRRNA
jgi:hypothetical protein